MQEALLAIGQKFSEAIASVDSLLNGVKTVIVGGFENHKIADSDTPAIQIIYRGSTIESRQVGCTKMKAVFDIHLVYNANQFTGESALRFDKTRKIDTSLLISDQVEKRANCEYDDSCICGVVLANQSLNFTETDGSLTLVGNGWQIESIEYGKFQRGSGSTYPTGEAIVSTSLFYNV